MRYILLNPLCTPERMREGDEGFDLKSSIETFIEPCSMVVIPLGVRFELPVGSWGLLTHRSSLALKQSCTMSLGIIDSNFNSELKAIVFNHHNYFPAKFKVGDRIAQLIIMKSVEAPTLEEVTSFNWVGKDGLGSSDSLSWYGEQYAEIKV